MTSRPKMAEPATDKIEPLRYVMSAQHMASCFAALGLKPAKSEIYKDLPEASESLPENVLGHSGGLNVEAGIIFSILANPKRVVIANEFFGGHIDGIETRFMSDEGGENWVIVSKKIDNSWDLALLTSGAQLLAMMDMFGGFSARTVHSSSFMAHLSLAAMAALAAIADTVRLGALRQELNGLPVDDIWRQSFSAQALLAVADQMQTQMSVKSKVLLVQILSAGAALNIDTVKAFGAGIKDLLQAELLEDDQTLSFDGHQIVSHLLQPDTALSFHILMRRSSEVIAESVFFLQTPNSILGGVWQRDNLGDIGSAMLTALQPEQALKLLEDAVTSDVGTSDVEAEAEADAAPHSAPKFCPECGAKNDRKLKFCSQCGTKY